MNCSRLHTHTHTAQGHHMEAESGDDRVGYGEVGRSTSALTLSGASRRKLSMLLNAPFHGDRFALISIAVRALLPIGMIKATETDMDSGLSQLKVTLTQQPTFAAVPFCVGGFHSSKKRDCDATRR
jgi:hypothetical protein